MSRVILEAPAGSMITFFDSWWVLPPTIDYSSNLPDTDSARKVKELLGKIRGMAIEKTLYSAESLPSYIYKLAEATNAEDITTPALFAILDFYGYYYLRLLLLIYESKPLVQLELKHTDSIEANLYWIYARVPIYKYRRGYSGELEIDREITKIDHYLPRAKATAVKVTVNTNKLVLLYYLSIMVNQLKHIADAAVELLYRVHMVPLGNWRS